MSTLGIVSAGATFGLQLLTFKPKRGFIPTSGTNTDPIVAQAVVEEDHDDEVDITEHPVEQGTVIADHAFVRPANLMITCGWSNSPNNVSSVFAAAGLATAGFAAAQSRAAQAVIAAVGLGVGIANLLGGGVSPVNQAYATLLDALRSRTLFDIYTAKRVYRNMLIKGLATNTDRKTENAMIIRVRCKQLLLAQTQTVTVPDSSVMANPAQNAAVVNQGTTYPVPAPNINVSAIP